MNAYQKLTKSKKFIGVQVHPLKTPLKIKSAVTLKLDGQRNLLFIDPHGNVFLVNNKLQFKKLKFHLHAFRNSIFDGEVYQNLFYAFDTLFFKGKDIRFNADLYQRINMYSQLPAFICKKVYFFDFDYLFLKKLLKSTSMDIDGLIFTPVYSPYASSCPLKWKSIITIDFQIRIIHETSKYTTIRLYTSDNKLFTCKLFPGIEQVKMKKNSEIKNGSVAEFFFKNKKFHFLRVRADKLKGNYSGVAYDNFNLIIHPFHLNLISSVIA